MVRRRAPAHDADGQLVRSPVQREVVGVAREELQRELSQLVPESQTSTEPMAARAVDRPGDVVVLPVAKDGPHVQ